MAPPQATFRNGSIPTVMLVHGAFADGSSWSGVVAALQAAGLGVVAPANPLRGLAHDSAHIAAGARQIDGPVLMVGHSYGGAVITVAGALADNVVGLVYVAAFIPEQGESIAELNGRFPDSALGAQLRPSAYPIDGTDETAVELTIAAESFPAIFAADLPAADTAVAAAVQRPVAAAAFDERAAAAAWKTLPSWAVVAAADQAINPDAERYMADRAGAQTIEIDGSHAIAVSHAAEIAELIRTAALSTQKSTAAAAA
jgi:pimeloyl-ACP methyl ester carboxylesterase